MKAKQIADSLENVKSLACPLYFIGSIELFNELLANRDGIVIFIQKQLVSPIVKLVPSNNPIVYAIVSDKGPHWFVFTSKIAAYKWLLSTWIEDPEEEDYEIVGYAPENYKV